MRNLPIWLLGLVSILSQVGCTPRVEIAAPEKPITINMNIKIDHEVRVRVERDLEDVISKDSDLF
jgi:hypothetical protein